MPGVSLRKVQDEAPHLVSLVKKTMNVASSLNIDLDAVRAAALTTIDDSGSAEHLFKSGEIQRVADLTFASSLVFDDDGSMPVSYFSSNVKDLGEITLGNSKDFIKRNKPRYNGTSYVSALRWVLEKTGYAGVDLGSGGGGFFGSKNKLSVKATAPYPFFVSFITDGEPQDGKEASELIKLMSQLPIFIQFVGVGPARFEYLRRLDDLDGRLIDNAGFFDAKEARDDEGMLKGLLNEFPAYVTAARAKGLIA